MAARPTHAKKMRRLRKALRRTPPAYIDLVEWLRSRRHAQTAGAARALLIDGKVMSESHVVGRERITVPGPDGEPIERWIESPRVPARLRDSLRVV